jgi:DNA-binding NarL/FixJ family response regulator
MKTSHPDHILVIDEMPLISVGLQEVFRVLNPPVSVEYTVSVFTALSSMLYEGKLFDLVVLDLQTSDHPEELYQSVAALKQRFGHPLIMIYSSAYDPVIIGKMAATGIDAYVHKYESIEEIKKAYQHLSRRENYVSEIFHILYYEYGQGVK